MEILGFLILKVNLFLYYSLGILILYQKKKSQNIINPMVENMNFNNHAKNKPLLNHIQITTLLLIAVAIVCLFLMNLFKVFQSDGGFDVYIRAIYIEFIREYSCNIILPIIVLSRKSAFRTFIWREIKAMIQKLWEDVSSRATILELN